VIGQGLGEHRQVTLQHRDRRVEVVSGAGAELYLPAGFNGKSAVQRPMVEVVEQLLQSFRIEVPSCWTGFVNQELQFDPDSAGWPMLEAGLREPALGRSLGDRLPVHQAGQIGDVIFDRHVRHLASGVRHFPPGSAPSR
jgi:hypothetical protein